MYGLQTMPHGPMTMKAGQILLGLGQNRRGAHRSLAKTAEETSCSRAPVYFAGRHQRQPAGFGSDSIRVFRTYTHRCAHRPGWPAGPLQRPCQRDPCRGPCQPGRPCRAGPVLMRPPARLARAARISRRVAASQRLRLRLD
jgi:hypothetical protein